MLKSLFITAARNLIRNPFFSFINIFGLSAGLTAFLLLFLYVYNEVTFDRFHAKHDRIYRLLENRMEYTKGLTVPYLIGNFPDVETGTRILDWTSHKLISGEQKINQPIVFVDSGFFDVFTFKFLEGNPREALDKKYGIVLTRKLAVKLFGNEPALNRIIDVDQNEHQLIVTGVVEDIPDNSSVEFEALTDYETGFELDPWLLEVHDWYNTYSASYVLLKKDADKELLESKFVPFVEENFLTGESAKPRLNLLPLKDLYNHITNNESFTYLLICVAAGIALIACINFINLFTAASSKRIREIGMRKTMGATSDQLVFLFLGEALIISFFAIIAGMFTTLLILPWYNDMFQAQLEFNISENPYLILILLVFWLISGLLGGLMPAFRLSKLPAISSVKGKVTQRSGRSGFGNGFASLQFAITIFLIIGTLTIRKQISFMQNHSLNFDSENVIVLRTSLEDYDDEEAAKQKFRAVINKLKADSRIAAVATSSQVPGTYIENYNMFYTDGWTKEEGIRLRQVDVGPGYFKTYGIKFLEGDYANEEYLTDSNAVVINHKALVDLGAEYGLNNLLRSSSKDGQPFRIIGVVEDFYYQGLHREIQPLIHYYSKYVDDQPAYISVRVKPGYMMVILDMLKDSWKSVPPAAELNYFFADEEITREYDFVIRTGSLAALFSVLAMILSCLGLLAMIMFVINRRIKEIGIRKVIGATSGNILQLFTIQYVKWIILSFVFAAPAALFIMNKWLENFAYKTILSWWILVLAGIIAISTAILTILWLTWRAAAKNPVEVLRYE
jgi:putative ABC transport system permease protein